MLCKSSLNGDFWECGLDSWDCMLVCGRLGGDGVGGGLVGWATKRVRPYGCAARFARSRRFRVANGARTSTLGLIVFAEMTELVALLGCLLENRRSCWK